jgi:hypothetical protein
VAPQFAPERQPFRMIWPKPVGTLRTVGKKSLYSFRSKGRRVMTFLNSVPIVAGTAGLVGVFSGW